MFKRLSQHSTVVVIDINISHICSRVQSSIAYTAYCFNRLKTMINVIRGFHKLIMNTQEKRNKRERGKRILKKKKRKELKDMANETLYCFIGHIR